MRTDFDPEVTCLIVRSDLRITFENREPEAFRIELELIHEKVPRKLYRVLFEVITERKIAEHLEKRMMPRGLSDFVEIVVLSARADTLLRRDSPLIIALLVTQKHVLELVHPRVREQESRVVRGQ